MPRLTNKQFLQQHDLLAHAHRDEPLIFGSVSTTEQWALHDFFAPAHDLSSEELLAHRRTITEEQPSLPHRAGRALAHVRANFTKAYVSANGDRKVFHHVLSHLAPGTSTPTRGDHSLRVVGVANPEPNRELYLKAILSFVDQLEGEELARRKKEHVA